MVLYCWRLSLWVGGKFWVETGVFINSKMAQWSELAFTALKIGNVILYLMNEFFAGLFLRIWSNTENFTSRWRWNVPYADWTPLYQGICGSVNITAFLTSTLARCEWSASRLCRFTHDLWAADTHWLRGWWTMEPVGTFLRKDKLLSIQEI